MGKGTNMADTKQTAELRLNGQVYQLPIHRQNKEEKMPNYTTQSKTNAV